MERTNRSWPLWQRLIAECLQQESTATARFLQLATVTIDGGPSCRTLVFRGWHGADGARSAGLRMVTDARSKKVEGLLKRPSGEACWYFAEARRQFRLTGDVNVVDGREDDEGLVTARAQVWRGLSDSARGSFCCGTPGESVQEGEVMTEGEKESMRMRRDPPEWFALVVLWPRRVDEVDLRGCKRRVFEKMKGEEWHESWVNP